MKIIQTDYDRLKTMLEDFCRDYQVKSHDNYPNMSTTRYVWDIFHGLMDNRQNNRMVEDYLFLRSLHDYLNDSHIETALKRIIITKG